MMKNKKPALAARAGRNERGQADVSTRNLTTSRLLRQLARRAAEIAGRCERDETRRKFSKLARFLRERAGGVR